MFWPFGIKAMAERLNSLHLDQDGNTPESIKYRVDLDLILIKNFRTLFAWSTSSIIGCNQQEVQAPQNGSRDLKWEYTWGTSPSTPEASPWYLIPRLQESHHNLSCHIWRWFFNRPLHGTRQSPPQLGGPCPSLHWVSYRQISRSGPQVDVRWRRGWSSYSYIE